MKYVFKLIVNKQVLQGGSKSLIKALENNGITIINH